MDIDDVLDQLRGLESLGQVIRWTTARQPRPDFIDVIVQDEYNHDVIVRVTDRVYAVFETS